jgi:hypothetical protein
MSTSRTRHVGARAFALVLVLVVILCGACSSPDFGDLATDHGYLQATGDHVFFLQWVKKGSSISGTFQDDDPSTGNSSVTFPLTGTISGNQISVTLKHFSGPKRTWNGSFTAHGLNLGIALGHGSATATNWAPASVDQVNSAVQHLNNVTTRYFPSDYLHFPPSYSVTSVTGRCPSQSDCLLVLQVAASSNATTLASADVTWKALFDLLGWTVVPTPNAGSTHGDDYSFSGYGWDGHFLVAQKNGANVVVAVWLQTCGSSCSPEAGSKVDT